MSSAQQEEEKKREESKNTIEKLIKLDKKHSNFDIIDVDLNKRLRIRNVQPNSSSMLSQIQQEHGLRYFWRHVNNYYFRKIDQQEFERLDYINLLLNSGVKAVPCKLQPQPLDTLNTEFLYDKVCNDNLKNLYGEDEVCNQLNYENTLKHIQISLMLNKLGSKGRDSKFLDQIIEEKKNCMPKYQPKKSTKKGQQTNSQILKEEGEQLEQILKKLKNENIEQEDELSKNLQNLEKQLHQETQENMKRMNDLTEKVKQEMQLNSIIYIENQFKDPFFQKPSTDKKRKELVNYSKQFQAVEYINAQMKFLKQLILKLESKQVAESIVMITNVKREARIFEEALNPKPGMLPEKLLVELDSYLEHSLLKFYNIPQKSLYSHICHNFSGFSQIHNQRTRPNFIKETNLLEAMKRKLDQTIDQDMKKDFDVCHHCKQLYQNQYLIKCNYRSSTMGLPIVNAAVTDPFIISQMELDNTWGRSYMNKRRNNYSQYLKKSYGELVCKRKFCRGCLKSNYDTSIIEAVTKSDWICPFCMGICYCTRCLRNDMITKLKGMYLLLGGDLKEIQQESLLDKFLKQSEEDKKKFNSSANKLSDQVKSKLKGFQQMNKMRHDMEKLRLLSSQICRREKMKLMLQNYQIQLSQQRFLNIQKESEELLQQSSKHKSGQPIEEKPKKNGIPAEEEDKDDDNDDIIDTPKKKKKIDKQAYSIKVKDLEDLVDDSSELVEQVKESLKKQTKNQNIHQEFSKKKKQQKQLKKMLQLKRKNQILQQNINEDTQKQQSQTNPNEPPCEQPSNPYKLRKELTQLLQGQNSKDFVSYNLKSNFKLLRSDIKNNKSKPEQ